MFCLKALLIMLFFDRLFSARLGLYNVKLNRISNCEDNGSGEITLDLQMHKISTRKAVFSGYINYGVPLDDHVAGDWQIAEWRSGGWAVNAFRDHSKNYCVGFKAKLPEFWTSFFKSMALQPLSCPVKAGNYTIRALPADLPRIARLPILFYGKFRITNSYYRNNNKSQKIGCSQYFATVSERPRV